MLELWLEKNWVPPDKVLMIPEEQAAVVSFSDAAGFYSHFHFIYVENKTFGTRWTPPSLP